jgi:hypothetical protein
MNVRVMGKSHEVIEPFCKRVSLTEHIFVKNKNFLEVSPYLHAMLAYT